MGARGGPNYEEPPMVAYGAPVYASTVRSECDAHYVPELGMSLVAFLIEPN